MHRVGVGVLGWRVAGLVAEVESMADDKIVDLEAHLIAKDVAEDAAMSKRVSADIDFVKGYLADKGYALGYAMHILMCAAYELAEENVTEGAAYDLAMTLLQSIHKAKTRK
jgi:hypothetical protein